MKSYCKQCGKFWEENTKHSWKYLKMYLTTFFNDLIHGNLDIKKCKICIKLKEKKEVIIFDRKQ